MDQSHSGLQLLTLECQTWSQVNVTQLGLKVVHWLKHVPKLEPEVERQCSMMMNSLKISMKSLFFHFFFHDFLQIWYQNDFFDVKRTKSIISDINSGVTKKRPKCEFIWIYLWIQEKNEFGVPRNVH